MSPVKRPENYRVSIKSFPDYYKKTTWNTNIFRNITINTWYKILETNLSNGKKKYVCIPRSFLVINVCNQGKTLCSPCKICIHSSTYIFMGNKLMMTFWRSKNVAVIVQITVPHHHYHHVHEGLGVLPVPWSSRWNWSLYLFLSRPMFLHPFGLHCNACFGILFVSILCTCCSHFSWYCFISFTMFCAHHSSLFDK